MSSSSSIAPTVPKHIGYILDGNRRWAKQHGLPTYEGHLAGVTALEDVIEGSVNAGVEYITFYTWSTENWNRAEEEVRSTLKIIRSIFKRELKRLTQEGCKFVALGDIESIPDDIRKLIKEAEDESRDGTRATLAMCFNYGGQQEIVRATQRIIEAGVDPKTIDKETFATYLDHPDIPPCDIVVRTSGEQRLSNFMLWRSAYSEFMFIDKLWPDMRSDDVDAIIKEYSQRTRRFGG
jgi:undecaprenyl diphosphate synthase